MKPFYEFTFRMVDSSLRIERILAAAIQDQLHLTVSPRVVARLLVERLLHIAPLVKSNPRVSRKPTPDIAPEEARFLPPGEYHVVISSPPATIVPSDAINCASYVAYQDESVLVLNKPSGLPSEPLHPFEPDTALAIAQRLSPTARPVHRIDTGTSGLLVYAKTEPEFTHLRSIWSGTLGSGPQVEKVYRAWTAMTTTGGKLLPLALPYTIDFPLAHSADRSGKMVALRGADPSLYEKKMRGKAMPCETVIIHQHAEKGDDGVLLQDLSVRINRGVHHQIRAHFGAMQRPILGDVLYGCHVPSTRMWLHAWSTRFVLSTGKPIHVECDLPAHWQSPLDA
jgi:tRNA pseudouridine32 synthase/23S rRNA pseudouridine746 synthase